jgi:hypothetical protein
MARERERSGAQGGAVAMRWEDVNA